MSVALKPRIDWVDAGRGLAIVLVVLFHATNWLGEAGFDVEGWRGFNEFAASVRLPLFFTMAGLFAQKWIEGPWRALWSSKLSLFVWVYLVWSVIATFTFMLGLNMQGAQGNYLSQLTNLLWAPLLPRFELWFIWALAIFFIAAKVLRRVPTPALLVAAGVLSVIAFANSSVANVGWIGMGKYFFFFLAGLKLRSLILRWSAVGSPIVLGGVAAVWAALAVGGVLLDLNLIPGYYFVSCVAGVGAGVALSRVLALVPGPRYLGSRTLPIYLTHTSVILVITWMLWKATDGNLPPFSEVALPPLLAVVAVALSLGISRLCGRSRLTSWIYRQPAWFARSSASV